MKEVQIQVPARICFFGDHQDYLGLPVIAGSINLFMGLTAHKIPEKEFRLDLKDINTQRVIDLDQLQGAAMPGDFFMSAIQVLQQKGFVFNQGYQITVTGNIPVNAGVSSSSALTVAWIRFLVAIQEPKVSVTDAEIGHWAYEAEVTYFNSPGGLMDQYTIAQMGLLAIETNTGVAEALPGHLGALVVAESGVAKETLAVLKNARNYQEQAIAQVRAKQPGFDIQHAKTTDYGAYLNCVDEVYQKHWYAAIHNYDLTKKAKAELSQEKPDMALLGSYMDAHQEILECHIQNTPEAMVQMMQAARKAGALGAKIIGSGGGGCMVAMATSENKEQIIRAFKDHGAKDAYEVQLTYPNH